MALKVHRPTSPGRRGRTSLDYRSLLSGHRPYKRLLKGKAKRAGRNGDGRITTRHQGGGAKQKFREIDFKYTKVGIPGKVETVEYDPNRSGFISLVVYRDGERRYHLSWKGAKVGDTFLVSPDAPIKPGNRLPLANIPVGTFVFAIELKPGAGARMARSAGGYAEVIAHDAGYALLKMPSTEVRKVLGTSMASVGTVSNDEYRLTNWGKAGASRRRGIRPTVRGTAMNPVDHPHGGGEGVQGRGLRRAKTMWGKPSGKGQKTRTPKKYSTKFIVTRRKVGKKR